jgi:hypothetical protein
MNVARGSRGFFQRFEPSPADEDGIAFACELRSERSPNAAPSTCQARGSATAARKICAVL